MCATSDVSLGCCCCCYTTSKRGSWSLPAAKQMPKQQAAQVVGALYASQPLSGLDTAHISSVSTFSLLAQMDRTLLSNLEAQAPQATGGNWAAGLGPDFMANLGRYRRYNVASLRDLLRVIRNKHNHFWELPEELQQQLGPLPEGFVRCGGCRLTRGKLVGAQLRGCPLLVCCQAQALFCGAAAPFMLHWHTGALWRGA